jgi:hypothetical protein
LTIFTRTPIRSLSARYPMGRDVIGESVSWDSKPGPAVSTRPHVGVPVGKLWILQSIYAHNAEDHPNLATFLLLDGQDPETDHARFAPGGITPVEVPPGRELCWTGLLYVPTGWKVGIRFEDMTGDGARCHWRYTAIET